jgi:hypothetical protein
VSAISAVVGVWLLGMWFTGLALVFQDDFTIPDKVATVVLWPGVIAVLTAVGVARLYLRLVSLIARFSWDAQEDHEAP